MVKGEIVMRLSLAKLKDLEFICELAALSLCPEREQRLIQMVHEYRLLLREEIRSMEGTETERLLWWPN